MCYFLCLTHRSLRSQDNASEVYSELESGKEIIYFQYCANDLGARQQHHRHEKISPRLSSKPSTLNCRPHTYIVGPHMIHKNCISNYSEV